MAPRRRRVARAGRALAARRGLRTLTRRDFGVGLAGLALFAVGFALGDGRTDAPPPPEIVRVEVTGTPVTASTPPAFAPDPATPLPTPEIVIEYRDRMSYVYVYIRCAIVGARASILSIDKQREIASEAGLVVCPS